MTRVCSGKYAEAAEKLAEQFGLMASFPSAWFTLLLTVQAATGRAASAGSQPTQGVLVRFLIQTSSIVLIQLSLSMRQQARPWKGRCRS